MPLGTPDTTGGLVSSMMKLLWYFYPALHSQCNSSSSEIICVVRKFPSYPFDIRRNWFVCRDKFTMGRFMDRNVPQRIFCTVRLWAVGSALNRKLNCQFTRLLLNLFISSVFHDLNQKKKNLFHFVVVFFKF